MTKAELISRLANKTGIKKVDVEKILTAFLEEAKEILKTVAIGKSFAEYVTDKKNS